MKVVAKPWSLSWRTLALCSVALTAALSQPLDSDLAGSGGVDTPPVTNEERPNIPINGTAVISGDGSNGGLEPVDDDITNDDNNNNNNDDSDIVIEIPGLDGTIFRRRSKYFFDAADGFDYAGGSYDPCPRKFCVHLSFYSDYGVESDFDAFVMDRYESKSPIGSSSFDVNGSIPLLTGRYNGLDFLNFTQADYAAFQNGTLNQSIPVHKTTWTLYPASPNENKLDIVLSLKQLYKLLPNYAPEGDGVVSDDQILLRATAELKSPTKAVSSVTPIIFNETGSSLIDIDYRSVILDGGKELALHIALNRKRFGSHMPFEAWKISDTCIEATQDFGQSEIYKCVVKTIQENRMKEVRHGRGVYDITDYIEECFGDFEIVFPNPEERSQKIDQNAQLFQNFADKGCPLDDTVVKGRMVQFAKQDAYDTFEFSDRSFSTAFSLKFFSSFIATSEFTYDTPASDIKTSIESKIRDILGLNAVIDVQKYDNLALIDEIERQIQNGTNKNENESVEANDEGILPVPSPVFGIKVIYRNIGVVPSESDAISTFPYTQEKNKGSVRMTSVPLDLTKFKYVAPPAGLKLDNDVNNNGGYDPHGSVLAYEQCYPLLMDCYWTAGCVQGVRRSFIHAIGNRDSVATGSFTSFQKDAQSWINRVSIGRALRDSRWSFSPTGYDKLVRYLACLSLPGNTLAGLVSSQNGDNFYSPKSFLRYIPGRVRFRVEVGADVYFQGPENQYANYQDTEDTNALVTFLNNLYGPSMNNVDLRITRRNFNDNTVEYEIEYKGLFRSLPFMYVFGLGSVSYEEFDIIVETQLDHVEMPQWVRFLTEIQILLGSNIDDYHDDSVSAGGDNNRTAGVISPYTEICGACQSLLTQCTSDQECAQIYLHALNGWNPSVSSNGDRFTADFSNAFWSGLSSTSSIASRTTATNLMRCISTSSCPIGFQKGFDYVTNKYLYYPTTVSGSGSKLDIYFDSNPFVLNGNAKLWTFTYKGESFTVELGESTEDLRSYLENSVLRGDSSVSLSITNDRMLRIRIEFRSVLLDLPQISHPDIVGFFPSKSTATFSSMYPYSPSWSNLLSWFDLDNGSDSNDDDDDDASGSNSNSNSMSPPIDVCSECFGAFQLCFNDPECNEAVRTKVLPFIPTTLASQTTFDGINTVFITDISPILQLAANQFSGDDSWDLFGDALSCVAKKVCNLQYTPLANMNGTFSIGPPGSGLTRLAVGQSYLQISLPLGSELQIELDNETLAYTENGQGFDGMRNFVASGLKGGLNVTGEVNFEQWNNKYNYYIVLGDYWGVLPQIQWSDAGVDVDFFPWNVAFTSLNSPPNWQRLIDWLAVTQQSNTGGPGSSDNNNNSPPPPPPIDGTSCSSCDQRLQACMNNWGCQNALNNYLLPYLGNQQMIIPTLSPLSTLDEQVWDADITTHLLNVVLPNAGPGRGDLVELLRCARTFSPACITDTPARTEWYLDDALTEFDLPLDAPFDVLAQGNSTNFNDSPMVVSELEVLLQNDMAPPGQPGMIQVTREEKNGNAHYRITYNGFVPQSFPDIFYDGNFIGNNRPWRAFFRYYGGEGEYTLPWNLFRTWLTPSGP